MGLVRLASRAVIGAFDRAADLDKVLNDLQRLGVRSVDVSIAAKAEALEATGAAQRGKGPFAVLGKNANWLSEPLRLDRSGIGALAVAGPLADVLAVSPNTSPIGAMVMQGIPQRDALIYNGLLQEGKILVLVGVADRMMGERVRVVLDRHGGQSIAYYAGRPYGTAFHGAGPGLS
jgi:hypothetical protein